MVPTLDGPRTEEGPQCPLSLEPTSVLTAKSTVTKITGGAGGHSGVLTPKFKVQGAHSLRVKGRVHTTDVHPLVCTDGEPLHSHRATSHTVVPIPLQNSPGKQPSAPWCPPHLLMPARPAPSSPPTHTHTFLSLLLSLEGAVHG